jgi:Thioesterase-like superfamily
LICWAVERIPTREPMQIARITVDLLRPVPVAPLQIKTEVVREGRKIQLCSVQLFADGVEVTRASVLKIRTAPLALPDTVKEELVVLPGPDESRIPKENPTGSNAFTSGVQMRVAKGGFRRPGPAAVWFRAERPIIAGETISPLMRAAITSDFCNGTSSMLDFREWTFINGDLNINLARMPIGEWILLDAESYVGPNGAGVAFARLGDVQGYFGRAVQSLVIEPRV